MTIQAWLIFMTAAVLEVGGDAIIRRGLRGNGVAVVLAGFLALGCYGLVVNLVKSIMDWSPRSRTSNPFSRSPVPMKADPSRVRAHLINGKRFGAFLRRLTGVGLGGNEQVPPGHLAPGEIRTMLVEVGAFVKEPMNGSGPAKAKLPR